eukprot:3458081-Prymnesium_polylepis.1
MIQDEVLAHRLGLIPILADPRKFHSRGPEEARAHRPLPLASSAAVYKSPPHGAVRRAARVARAGCERGERHLVPAQGRVLAPEARHRLRHQRHDQRPRDVQHAAVDPTGRPAESLQGATHQAGARRHPDRQAATRPGARRRPVCALRCPALRCPAP